jgi:hypothetical protein
MTYWIPLKEGFGGEKRPKDKVRTGDFTDKSIIIRSNSV